VPSEHAVLAGFVEFEHFRAAVEELRATGLTDFTLYSPVSLKEWDYLSPHRASPVRLFSLVSGFIGAALGYLLCLGSAFLYNLIVGGKPVVSWLPYTVIAFEATVLTSALTTVAAVVVYARLYPRPAPRVYDISFTVDQFGVAVPCTDECRADIVALLKRQGATQIREL
jgi:molybdopterin-containing oxidoreductase family membrane subunit